MEYFSVNKIQHKTKFNINNYVELSKKEKKEKFLKIVLIQIFKTQKMYLLKSY